MKATWQIEDKGKTITITLIRGKDMIADFAKALRDMRWMINTASQDMLGSSLRNSLLDRIEEALYQEVTDGR